jgi:hypothetical protein
MVLLYGALESASCVKGCVGFKAPFFYLIATCNSRASCGPLSPPVLSIKGVFEISPLNAATGYVLIRPSNDFQSHQ